MAHYIEMTNIYDQTVFVNPELVTYVLHYEDDITYIYFANEHFVAVKGKALAIARELTEN